MENPVWKIFCRYLLVLFLLLLSSNVYSQMAVAIFNAEWNTANSVNWIHELKECKTISYVDIAKQKEAATKHKKAVVPTIIIFKDGEEAVRFQADLSFKLLATKEEVQEAIDELLMSDF